MNFKKEFLILIVVIIVLFFNFIYEDSNKLTNEEIQWLKSQKEIIYAANENAPPLRFVDDVDNQYKGVVVDLINQISLETGTNIKTVPMQWSEALSSLAEGSTQICDMFISPERGKNYLFTNPIYNLRTVLLFIDKNIGNLRDINSITIATEKGDYANSYLQINYPNAELIYVDNVEEGFLMLLNKEVDAVVGDEPVILYLLKQNRNSQLNLFNKVLYEKDVVFAVPKSKPELVSILNKAIKNLERKGQLEKIQQKWFGISTPLKKSINIYDVFKFVAFPVIIIGIMFVFIVLNNHSLKKLVKLKTQELEYSRNELRNIFDGVNDFMVVIDENKKIINANKAFVKYLGISLQEAIGKNCNEYLKNSFSECYEYTLDEVIKNNNKITQEKMVKNEVYEISFQPVIELNKTIIITIRNITVDKINRNQMLQTNKMVAVGQLAAGMAHEIRNPLGIIRTQSYLLSLNDKIDESMKKSLNFIDNSINRASNIIDNVLNFSRISSNKKESIFIEKIISNIIELHSDLIKKKNIIIEVNCFIEEKILINVESLQHIILNLVSNSIDAINYGGYLKINIIKENNNIILICEDNGIGIEEKHMESLFNPFFTTKELGKGTGLGLYIVYSEVQKLNGYIDVKSKLNKGTMFKIILPIEKEVL